MQPKGELCAPSYSGKLSRKKTFVNWWKIQFLRRKLSQILTRAAPKDATSPNFIEKTFANSHKTLKFAQVFSLESFPLYLTDYLYMYIPSFILRHHPAFCSCGGERTRMHGWRVWSTNHVGLGMKPTNHLGLGMRPTNHMGLGMWPTNHLGLGMRPTNHWFGNETN